MRLEIRNNRDGYRWRCHTRGWRQTTGLRRGTIFDGFRSHLGRLTYTIYLWSLRTTAVDIARQAGLDEHNVGDMRWKLRVICSNDLRRNPVCIRSALGRPVQVDESMFHHKQRAHVGRIARRSIWVFGMVDTRYRPARPYMQVVPNRSRRTLVPIINQRLAGRNQTIHSDMWRAYHNLPHFVPNCGLHQTVNHSQNFVDPVTGAHTQHIESSWNRVKYNLKRAKGCRRARLQSYLDEFMWLDWKAGNDVFQSIVARINIDSPQ